MDKVVVTNIEKATAVEQLQVATEQEKELQEEISHATAKLESIRVELGSAQ